MTDTQADVICELYDGIFDPLAWDRSISTIAQTIPELRPTLAIERWHPARNVIVRYANIDHQLIHDYMTEYSAMNAFRVATERAKPHDVFLTTDHVPQEELVKTAFWADFLTKLDDVRAVSGSFLARSQSHFACLAFHYAYKEQNFSIPPGMQLHRAIAPHARRAFQLAIRGAVVMDHQRIEGALLNLEIPAVVFDPDGKIIRTNTAAEAMLATSTAMRLGAGGTVTSACQASASAIEAAILATLRERRTTTIDLIGSDGKSIQAHFLPMQRREVTNELVTEFIDNYEPAAVMYLSGPGAERR
ncbi:hypothetical protein [Acuticoccus kandeliae]|uniref:hypothetical protein n=1 Tax=Acuticoccus kandeliae TaxID=2073160 RepID=UPI000D3E7B2B|nr:hypothetical protein [Acuticoccus kandeliae]